MQKVPHVALALTALALAACGGAPAAKSPAPSAAPPIAASEVGAHGDKYKGRKLSVTGIYKQGFSNGGRPGDQWAILIADAPASTDTVACLVPAKVEIPGNYPKLVAEGTVSAEPGERVYLKDCTYKVEK